MDTHSLGPLWDHGAHWFHSAERNPLRRLAEVLGHRFRARRHFVRGTATGWSSDAFIGGAYSAAKPGWAALRRRFLEPPHDRGFIAGEHASLNAMATAHGAHLSGVRAAARAARKLGSVASLLETV